MSRIAKVKILIDKALLALVMIYLDKGAQNWASSAIQHAPKME